MKALYVDWFHLYITDDKEVTDEEGKIGMRDIYIGCIFQPIYHAQVISLRKPRTNM